MKWTVRVLLGGMVSVAIAGCAATPAPGPATTARLDVESSAAPPARPAPACPPGTIADGGRCRRQRGIVIDQREGGTGDERGEGNGSPAEPCPGGVVIDQRCTSSPPPPPEPPPLSWLDVLISMFGDG